jgi:rfaE bifunctional protein kinase chain/domain
LKGILMKPIEGIRILVVGDIMLDKYVVGNVERISPEAPVPIVHVTEEYHTLGGCGNVARNIAELGAKVDCLSSIASDVTGELIVEELIKLKIRSCLFYGNKQTTSKERVIADQRKVQMIRIDREITTSVDPYTAIAFFEKKCKHIKYDMVVVSDYAKGMISYKLMDFLKITQGAPIIVDPKPQNGSYYDGVFMITPNEKEWHSMLFSAAYNLSNVNYILTTMGSKGMLLTDNEFDQTEEIPAEPVDVYNVSGAGDTVVAVMSVCLSMGFDPLTSAKIANKCAGYVVTKPGTSVVSKNIFMKHMDCVTGGK